MTHHRDRIEPVPPPTAVLDLVELRRRWGQLDALDGAKRRHPSTPKRHG